MEDVASQADLHRLVSWGNGQWGAGGLAFPETVAADHEGDSDIVDEDLEGLNVSVVRFVATKEGWKRPRNALLSAPKRARSPDVLPEREYVIGNNASTLTNIVLGLLPSSDANVDWKVVLDCCSSCFSSDHTGRKLPQLFTMELLERSERRARSACGSFPDIRSVG
jgi:hypothetical protein